MKILKLLFNNKFYWISGELCKNSEATNLNQRLFTVVYLFSEEPDNNSVVSTWENHLSKCQSLHKSANGNKQNF